MDDRKAVILDISSDEEVAGGGGGGYGENDDFDWISKILEEVNGGGAGNTVAEEDDDEVVVVGENWRNLKPLRMLKSSETVAKSPVSVKTANDDEDDDDCVVLDGDPDKPVVIESNKTGKANGDNGDDNDSDDDVLVVSEKGQVACRDYPHPRHLCAKFPFASTPHETHCNQCHCYVCDSLAPCVHWATGNSTDHCHATDKDKYWIVQRSIVKKSGSVSPAVPKISVSSAPLGLHLMNQVSSFSSNPATLNQPSMLPMIRSCSTSTGFGAPNIIRHGRTQQTGHVIPRPRFQPPPVPQQLCNVTQRDRRHLAGNLRPRVFSPGSTFKRPGIVRVSSAGNKVGNFSSKTNHRSQHYGITSTSNGHRSSYQQNLGGRPIYVPSQPQLYSQSHVTSNPVNFGPCWPQMPSSQPHTVGIETVASSPEVTFQASGDSNYRNIVPSRCQFPFPQPYVGSVSVDSMASSLEVTSQPNMDSVLGNPSSQCHSVPQPNGGNNVGNLVLSQPLFFSNLDMSSTNENPTATQPPVSNLECELLSESQDFLLPPAFNGSQNVLQQANQSQGALDPGAVGLNFNWINPSSDDIKQLPANNVQLQSVVQEAEHSLPVDANSQLPGAATIESAPLNFQFDDWDFDHPTDSAEGGMPPETDIYSPDAALIDAVFFNT